VFSSASGMPVSRQATPHLNMLLPGTLLDAALSTYGAKDHDKRTRPCMAMNDGSCELASEASLQKMERLQNEDRFAAQAALG